MTAVVRAGVCLYCGCTDENACRTPPCGDPCSWLNRDRTVCSGPDCASKYERELAARRAINVRRAWRDDSAGRAPRYGSRNRKKKKRGKAA